MRVKVEILVPVSWLSINLGGYCAIHLPDDKKMQKGKVTFILFLHSELNRVLIWFRCLNKSSFLLAGITVQVP